MVTAQLRRWAIELSAYHYKIKFRPTQAHSNADGLSRLPWNEGHFEHHYDEPGIFNMSQLESLPVTSTCLRTLTSRHRVLSRVLRSVKEGWPWQGEPELQPYLR